VALFQKLKDVAVNRIRRSDRAEISSVCTLQRETYPIETDQQADHLQQAHEHLLVPRGVDQRSDQSVMSLSFMGR